MNKESNAPLESRPPFTQWSKQELAELPKRIQNLKHKKIIAAILALVAYGFFISFTQPVVPIDRDASISPYDQYSLALQITIGVLLAVFFWYLQLSENDKIEKVLEEQKLLSKEMHKYIVQQQKIQDSIRSSSLSNIRGNLESAKRSIEQLVRYFLNYKETDIRKKALHLDDQLKVYRGFKWQINAINQQVAIVRPYVSAELTGKIETAVIRVEQLGLSSADSPDTYIFSAKAPESYDNWFDYANSTLEIINSVLEILPKM